MTSLRARFHPALAGAALVTLLLLFGPAPAVRAGDEDAADPPPPEAPEAPEPPGPPTPKQPSDGEVMLPAAPGWHASLMLDNQGTGVWTVGAMKVFEPFGCPEVVALDDLGRLHVLTSYSGRWYSMPAVFDGKWLGGLARADVDPRVPGLEIYTGSQRGNVYQIVAHREIALESRRIAYLPGREVHTVLAGDLDPAHPGPEVLVFTRPGGLFRLTPTGADGRFEVVHVGELAGRVRDAVVLPRAAAAPVEILTVARSGRVEVLRLEAEGVRASLVHEAAMGFGRVALAPGRGAASLVAYTTRDDGVILRHERRGPDVWHTEAIYLGPQGPRGIAAGRFDSDPAMETVAVFGYSGRIELLTRRAEGWQAETIFVDRDKGHWLCAAELDGRNATDELVSAGYSGRVVLLARPPGTGRSETAAQR